MGAAMRWLLGFLKLFGRRARIETREPWVMLAEELAREKLREHKLNSRWRRAVVTIEPEQVTLKTSNMSPKEQKVSDQNMTVRVIRLDVELENSDKPVSVFCRLFSNNRGKWQEELVECTLDETLTGPLGRRRDLKPRLGDTKLPGHDKPSATETKGGQTPEKDDNAPVVDKEDSIPVTDPVDASPEDPKPPQAGVH
jgi:hypothetical protein